MVGHSEGSRRSGSAGPRNEAGFAGAALGCDRGSRRWPKRSFKQSILKAGLFGQSFLLLVKTASGETFNRDELTAAHRDLPFGTRVRVTALATGKSVVVRITDRGPTLRSRVLDLSTAAARNLGITDRGVTDIRAEVL